MTKTEIRRILCPTDFSAFSGPSFERAVTLAAWYEAALTVLHVVPDTMAPASGLTRMANPVLLDPTLPAVIEHDLSCVVAPARRAGLRAEGELREGKPAAEIVRVAQELPADLIVMGTHGRSGFQRWVLGSVAETVLRRAPCPVLTVPAGAVQRPSSMLFKRILCATDFSPASEVAAGYAASLAAEADGCLLLVHVLDRPAAGARIEAGPDGNGRRPDFECAARVLLRRALPESARDGYLLEEIVTHGKAAPEILRLATEWEAGLIVMGAHGRSLLDLMAFGSVTHQVVREAACPVLTVRPPSAVTSTTRNSHARGADR
jgi:nucleotide-binding universal stress UspA family protein